jgi:hypothetical protein
MPRRGRGHGSGDDGGDQDRLALVEAFLVAGYFFAADHGRTAVGRRRHSDDCGISAC